MKMFRQGDVLIEEVAGLPREVFGTKLEVVPREGGRVILAHGEVTGHAHAIADQTAVLMSFKVKGKEQEEERYLKIERSSTLSHEEHGPIELPPGKYRITIQRQWEPTGWSPVVD